MRNYKKEMEWREKRYNEIRAFIDVNLAKKLREKLKKEEKTIAEWISENARKYIEIND